MKPHESHPIFCGTDFSANADQAANVAAALAHRLNKPLVLLHVADEFNAHAETEEGLEAVLQAARERLRVESGRLLASGAAVSGEVLHGRVAEQAITAFVAEHPAELVVVSAVSKTAFDRWTLGSVSERIAEAASTATLVVRAAAPFEAWTRGERALKVFVAADFSASATAALRWAAGLRRIGPCEVTVACVASPQQEQERLGVSGPQSLTEHRPEVQSILERDLREKAAAAFGSEPVEICVRAGSGRVDAHLVDLAAAAQADIIVVGTHQRRGLGLLRLGSVSRGILRHARRNVAVVPAAAVPASAPAVRPCRRVLAAVDLTDNGGLALPYAYSVVNEGGTVHLLHVTPRRGLPDAAAGAISTTDESAQRLAHGSARLCEFIPAEVEARSILTEVGIIEEDDVARAICQAAESFNADLVCIGAHARPGAAARVMGSVALGVLQHCRRPVLVVWPPVE